VALGGADVITVSYNTPHSVKVFGTLENTQAHQELLIRGGAAANGVPVVAAGKAGVEYGQQYSDGSCIVDHAGTVVAKAKTDDDELVIADLDLATAARYQELVRLTSDRRHAAYEALSRPTP
jgi:predicted amidohydrolase